MFSDAEINEILDRLRSEYPDAGCALGHRNTFELIVAVALSAQTTDVSVNKVTPALFAKYPSAEALAEASQEDVIEIIKAIGMYKTKSKNIIAMAKSLVENHGGDVPCDYKNLLLCRAWGEKRRMSFSL
ncbi:MAG: hypothetical protein V8Q42_06935 [Anaerovoracaceae bacterium]